MTTPIDPTKLDDELKPAPSFRRDAARVRIDVREDRAPGEVEADQLLEASVHARRAARRLLRDEHLAEDAVQQAWLALVQTPPRDEGNLGAWFSSVARNAARRALRGRLRAALRERRVATSERTPDSAPAMQIDRDDAIRTVAAAVRRLDEPYRSTIVERYFRGRSLREIAQRDGVPLATLRSRLQRAHGRLRIDLERGFGDRREAARGLLAICGATSTIVFLVLAGWDAAVRSVARTLHTSRVARRAPAALAVVVGVTVAVRMWDAPPPPADTYASAETESQVANVRGAEANVPTRVVLEDDPVASTEVEPPLTVRVNHTEDGAAAAFIRVRALSWATPAPHLSLVTVTTDAEGVALLPDLPEGPATLLLDAGAAHDVTISRASPRQVSLQLPVGVDVHGSVLQPGGSPAAACPVWLSTDDAGLAGSVVATTDPNGAFSLRDVPPGRLLGALARTSADRSGGLGESPFGPSRLARVGGMIGASAEIHLELGATAAEIEGTVRAPNGNPIAGATVEIEVGDRSSDPGLSGARSTARRFAAAGDPQASARCYPPVTIQTATDGTFHAAGLHPGPAVVWVRAADAALTRVPIHLNADTRQTAAISLVREATLRGQVLDRRGFPLAGALVCTGEPLSIRGSMAVSDERGRYILSGLAGGPLGCEVVGADGEATATLEVTAGADHPWDPQLGGRAVFGRVVNPAGQPVPDLIVEASSPTPLFRGVRTDLDGRFRLASVPPAGGLVRVVGPGGVPWGGLVIGPRDREVEVVVSDPAIAGASLSFAIDAAGSELLAVRLTARSFATERRLPGGGQIHFTNLPPDTYAVIGVTRAGEVPLRTVELTANEHQTLDPIVLPPPRTQPSLSPLAVMSRR